MSSRWVATGVTLAVVATMALPGCCKQNDNSETYDPPPLLDTPIPPPVATGSVVRFNKVPLMVEMPAGWEQSQNTAQWLVYRPAGGGALVAMSGEKSCSLVIDRFAGALRELGLTSVNWGTPQHTTINGLRAKVAAGTAIEASQLSYVKYSLTYAAGGNGCLITLYNVWQSKAGDYRATADNIITSVRTQ
jgi:hypothetical protein